MSVPCLLKIINYADVANVRPLLNVICPLPWELTGEALLQNCPCDFSKHRYCVSTSDFVHLVTFFVLKAGFQSKLDSYASVNTKF